MSDSAADQLQHVLDEHFRGTQSVQVLEAGCGSLSHVKLPENSYIVGIDISQEQLDKNSALNEKILGDIEEYDFKASRFDLIICWELIEHLQNPGKALANLKHALSDNGLIVIAAPNPSSMKGLVTRLTPHWFHIFVYRYIFDKKDAGNPGCAPFRTIYAKEMYPEAIKKFAAKNDFAVCFYKERDRFPKVFLEKRRFWFALYKAFASSLALVTAGRLGGTNNTDFVLVLKNS